MITEVERNYQPKAWVSVDEVPKEASSLSVSEFFYVCTSDSQRFKDLCSRGYGERAMLLDYEMISLDLDPICGSAISKLKDGTYFLTVYTGPTSSAHFSLPPGELTLN